MTRHRRDIAENFPRRMSLDAVGSASEERGLRAFFSDVSLSRMTEIQEVATLAGLRVEEVPALALRLEGSVRRTQNFVSAVLEFPYEHMLLLRQTVLGLWRDLGYALRQLGLGLACLSMLIGLSHGNGRRLASLLIGIGLCWLFPALPFLVVLPACVFIALYT